MNRRTTGMSVLIIFLWLCPLARGQNTAAVHGKVVDADGRPVVSAFAVIIGQETQLTRAATTDDAGGFEFTSLPVGTYSLQITADGLSTFASGEIRASIGQVVKLDVVMGPTESHSATAQSNSAPLVESSNTQIGVVMNELEVTQLPLKSRDTFELLQLQPGVESTLGAEIFFGGDRPGVVSVDGGRARSNNYMINGGHSGDQMVNFPSIQPSPDSVSEFRVISHNYDAEFGRNSGSVLNVITKSGSNALHGTLFEFLRNDVLNSKGFFDIQRPEFTQNEFGGTAGGAIRHDKTFFFASYEGQRVRHGISSDSVTVPTAPERGGDFSAGPAFAGVLQDATVASVLNQRPGCAAAVAAGGGAAIAPGTAYSSVFPGNIIPPACFDRTAAGLLNQYVPAADTGQNLFQAAPLSKQRKDLVSARLDHNLTIAQQFSVYYYGSDGYDDEPFATFQNLGADLPGFGSLTRERFQQANVSHTWTINARTNNEFRFIYYRDAQGELGSPARTNLVQDSCSTVPATNCFADPAYPGLGITPGYGASHEGVPYINLAGGFTIGNNYGGSFGQVGNVFELIDSYTRISGRHTLKFGADVRNQRLHQTYYYNVNGELGFSGGGPNDVGFSDLAPNYLLGLADTFSQGSANSEDVRTTQWHVFGQDDWKLKSNVVLNYGLRWEFNTPQADASQRIQAFRPGQATSVYPCQLSPTDPLLGVIGSNDCSPTGPASSVFPLGLVMPGDRGVPNGLTNPYYTSFAPRLGLAWSPALNGGWLAKVSGGPGKSSVRLGWGMFYDSNEELVMESFAAQPPFGRSVSLENVFLSTPFLGQNGQANPNSLTGVLDPTRGSPVDFALFRPILLFGNFPRTLPSQYSEHYHLTVQRELARNSLLQFGYVGSQGHRLLATQDQDFGNAQTCLDLNEIPGMSCGPFEADDSYSIPAGAIPPGVTLHLPYGPVPTVTGPNPTPITLVGLRKYSSPMCAPTTGQGCPPDGIPVLSDIFSMQPLANSSYNAFQAMWRRQFSSGLQFLASYTLSKSLDNASSFEESVNPIDPRLSRSLSMFDARHRMVLSYYWPLRGWEGGRWSKRATTGWALSGIATLQSGFPIRITSTSDQELMSSIDYESAGEPDQIAPLHRLNPKTSGGYYFDPASFVNAPLGQIGNATRTLCCGPGIANLDFAVHKTIVLQETKALEFRTEFFNTLNHVQFLNPDGNITDGSSFGLVTSARDPRIIQFALRLNF